MIHGRRVGGWFVSSVVDVPCGLEAKGVDPDKKVRGDGLGCYPTFSRWGSVGAVSPPSGVRAEPRRQTHFGTIFLKINL